jgi:hypothetical protein
MAVLMTAPWTSSETTAAIIPAFVTALQTVEDVKRNKKVTAGQMAYTYADLVAVLEATKTVLTTNGLAITQTASDAGVQTILLHSSGEWLAFPPLTIGTAQNTPQARGSAISYSRRYSMLAVLGIATEDDDGKAASTEPKAPKAPRATTAKTANGGPSRAQINMLMAIYTRLGITDRHEQKILAAGVLGIATLESHNDLTPGKDGQMSELIDALADVQAGDRDLVLNADGVAVAVTKGKAA